MRHPPEALYSFTIPSTHDDTPLDCRVYHPDTLQPTRSSPLRSRAHDRIRGIVMAHPYAPMGGSYDDRIVSIVVAEFLTAGWIVGTFNFRGAHGSKGRTSWSGRPELDDYTSFAAFFMHYMCYLQPCPELPVPKEASTEPLAPELTTTVPVVILGGYSYGSLILRHLPPIPSILQPFAAPIAGFANNEIIIRARKLAGQSNIFWSNIARDQERESRPRKKDHEPKLSLTMGGEETTPEKRRSSREVRRSIDRGPSGEFGNRLLTFSHGHCRRNQDSLSSLIVQTAKCAPMTMPQVRYLLVSPLTPPVSTLAAPALGNQFWHRRRASSEDVIGQHIALAVYGGQDMFTSAKRIRDWSEQMKALQGSRFSSVEVANAGHFWMEADAEEKLRSALRQWEVEIR
ncbi:hypothetical protein ACEQ8H_004399 [Pleosporales sp. CAS-2024a]